MEIFDPFKVEWVRLSWHSKIILQPAPPVSRIYGVPITGGPCAVWQGGTNGKGHGKVSINGKKVFLHRFAFACHHGIILGPADIIDHICRCRPCFNPFHHECTTPLENFERGDGPLYLFKSFRDIIRKDMDEIPF